MAAVDEKAALELVISLHRLLRTLRRAGPAGRIPPTQLIVLALLNQFGPSRIGVIAERIPCSQPTLRWCWRAWSWLAWYGENPTPPTAAPPGQSSRRPATRH